MNFSPFGSPFSTSIPSIHQFAAKLSQDVCSSPFPNSPDDIALTNRYTANGIPSFTQHHHATAQQQLLAASSKTNGNYLNSQNLYSQAPTLKRQSFDQQNFDFFSVRSPQDHNKGLGSNGDNKRKDLDSTSKPVQSLQTSQNQQSSSPPSALLSSPWQNLSASSSTVVDYLSQLPANSLPISLHELLKYSAETLKKDNVNQTGGLQNNNDAQLNMLNNGTINVNTLNIAGNTNGNLSTNNSNALSTLSTINTSHLHNTTLVAKKKKKKKPEKEKKPKPKPGEIRLSTALDGSTLYCCPECHMALPERDLLEQHLLGHNLERRFVCDICGAALKRKDHLTRHKQSHNPERPFVCSVCLKAFKRKEQLTLHFVIHSGEKKHVCTECGKGFYRKDHLRKHTRSHIARRVKAELSQQGAIGRWKSKTKAKASLIRQEMIKTGGGSPKIPSLTPTEERLLSILGWKSITGDDNPELGFLPKQCTEANASQCLEASTSQCMETSASHSIEASTSQCIEASIDQCLEASTSCALPKLIPLGNIEDEKPRAIIISGQSGLGNKKKKIRTTSEKSKKYVSLQKMHTKTLSNLNAIEKNTSIMASALMPISADVKRYVDSMTEHN